MFRRITYFLDGRLYEWILSLSLLGLAVEILLWPDTIKASAFRWTTSLTPSWVMGVGSLAVSVSGLIALSFNGRSKIIGPFTRSVCACFRAVVWAQFALALLLLSLEQSTPSPGLPFWTMFASAEIYVAYRAMIDVRRAL